MPFNIRNMEDEKKARMGVVECVNKKLIEPFQVLFDKEGGYIIRSGRISSVYIVGEWVAGWSHFF